MKTTFVIIISLLAFHFSHAQKKKRNAAAFIQYYVGCEVKECYGTRGFTFTDTTKLQVRICEHHLGCVNDDGGKWTKTSTGFIIETLEDFKSIDDLNGQLYRITKDAYEILLHESVVGDSLKIIGEIEDEFKKDEMYETYFANQPLTADLAILKQRMLYRIIRSEFSWKYKLLVKEVIW